MARRWRFRRMRTQGGCRRRTWELCSSSRYGGKLAPGGVWSRPPGAGPSFWPTSGGLNRDQCGFVGAACVLDLDRAAVGSVACFLARPCGRSADLQDQVPSARATNHRSWIRETLLAGHEAAQAMGWIRITRNAGSARKRTGHVSKDAGNRGRRKRWPSCWPAPRTVDQA